MDFMSTQEASSSLSSPFSSTPRWTYDVFLSFRGKDTRCGFTDHLYDALIRNGTLTFRDDEELETGKPISQELLKAIEESNFAIVILSKNYASSAWCLDELVEIVRCMKEKKMIVVPVFYHVNPSDVRHQRGTFEEAFTEHEAGCNIQKVETWRAALREVANLSGCHVEESHYESEKIRQIVEDILHRLNSTFSSITKDLVGIDSSVEKLITLYLGHGNGACMTGICGMGGLGKTTLARVIYETVRNHFEGFSFIANVGEVSKNNGLNQLQKQLLEQILKERKIKIWDDYHGVDMIKKRLCHKKVLVVLDDVDELDQLEKLVGDLSWFGASSWIIITTRDEHLLDQHGIGEHDRYKPCVLRDLDALKLFCLKAFKKEKPIEGYEKLSGDIVYYANGLPLALKILGSFLLGRTRDEWQSELEKLKKFPERKTFDILKVSYDRLDNMQRKIFLDIACFFNGETKDRVIAILENCDFNAKIDIRVLIDKSLVTIENEKLWMHDLLQEMGREIVRQESPEEPGERSRLWLREDLFNVLKKDTATKAIQAIVLKSRIWEDRYQNFEAFHEPFGGFNATKAIQARVLKSCVREEGYQNFEAFHEPFGGFNATKAIQARVRKSCVRKEGYQNFEAFHEPFGGFNATKAIQARVRKSCVREEGYQNFEAFHEPFSKMCNLRLLIIHDVQIPNGLNHVPDDLRYLEWFRYSSRCLPSSFQPKELIGLNLQVSGIKYLWEGRKYLDKLKCIDLRDSKSLIETPDFTGVPRLEVLYLSGCIKLVEIHPSIGQLRRLIELDLQVCPSLTNLPSMTTEMESLTILNLRWCHNLIEIHPSIGQLRRLVNLDLLGCESLTNLPSMTTEMESLKILNLCVCKNLVEIHPSIGQLRRLVELDLAGCQSLTNLPSMTTEMESLKILHLRGCSNLVEIHPSIGQLRRLVELDLQFCQSLTNLPSMTTEMESLEILNLRGCRNLIEIHPSIGQLRRLVNLDLQDCPSLTNLPSMTTEMESLTILNLRGCSNLIEIHPFGQLRRLVELDLQFCRSLTNLPSMTEMESLKILNLKGCSNLIEIHPSIGQLRRLVNLDLLGCQSLTNLPSMTTEMESLAILNLGRCSNLIEIPPSIGQLRRLVNLDLQDCQSLTNLPSMNTEMESLNLSCCSNLIEMHPSIGQLRRLVNLNLQFCRSLTNLLSMTTELQSLKTLNLRGCSNLIEIHPSIGQLRQLVNLVLEGCQSLTNLPCMNTEMESLDLRGCSNLIEIHPSIGQLRRLVNLDLQDCRSLTNFPSITTEMQSLKTLNLTGCLKLRNISEFKGILKSLSTVNLVRTAIEKLPSSIDCLTALNTLNLADCKNLKCLPSNMDSLSSLEILILSGCSKLANLPETVWKMKHLKILYLNGRSQLEGIGFNGIISFSSLQHLTLRGTSFVSLPRSISQLSNLETLDLSHCLYLRSLPELPSTVKYINAQECYSLQPSHNGGRYDESSGRVAYTILHRFLQGLLCQKTGNETSTKRTENKFRIDFQIIIPGNSIPLWLTHRSLGNSIRIELPPNWCNSTWMGFVLCARMDGYDSFLGLGAHVIAINPSGRNSLPCGIYGPKFGWGQICLMYFSRDYWFAQVPNGECSEIEVKFDNIVSFDKNKDRLKALECGVRLVYEQEVEEFNQTIAQCGSNNTD